MNGFIEIKSTNNTNVIIRADKIQLVMEKKKGCVVVLDDFRLINTTASYESVKKAWLERYMQE